MKKIFSIICVVLSLSGCEQAFDFVQGKDVYDHIRVPPMEFESLYAAGTWIAHNVDYYMSDPYEWHSPYQTVVSKKGMCVDYSTTLLWYAVMRFNADYSNSYVLGIEEYSGSRHALCVINGEVIEPQTYNIRTKPYKSVTGKWNLDEALEIVYYNYRNRSAEMNIPILD